MNMKIDLCMQQNFNFVFVNSMLLRQINDDFFLALINKHYAHYNRKKCVNIYVNFQFNEN